MTKHEGMTKEARGSHESAQRIPANEIIRVIRGQICFLALTCVLVVRSN